MAAIFNLVANFWSYLNYFKSETFLIPNKTFVEIYIGLLQDIVLCRCFKKIFLNQIAAILGLAAITTFKRKIRDGNIPGITEYIWIKFFHHVARFTKNV